MRKASLQQGFTLVELLVVLAIIIIIGAITLPAITSNMRSSALTLGTQQVLNEIVAARQAALTQNRFVEIRFYQYAKPSMPGEAVGNPSTGKFRAMQSFVIDPSGSATAFDKVRVLPDSVIMDSDSTLSTLLSPTLAKSWTANDPQISLPTVGIAYNARVFQFQPDGSTNLNPIGQEWFVTLHDLSLGDNLASLPVNFFTVQIDALNGHIQNYRP